MDEDMPLGMKVDLGLGQCHIVLDGHSPPPKKGTAAPAFRRMSIVVKRSSIAASTEHLYLVP